MKINKLILRIQHFLGFNKESQHIDDVTVNIWCDHWDKAKRDRIMGYGRNKETKEDIDEIKSQIFQLFKEDPKLESRCLISAQVWITFYLSSDKHKEGSLMKMLYYSKDKTLYYPCEEDRKSWERDQKIESIID